VITAIRIKTLDVGKAIGAHEGITRVIIGLRMPGAVNFQHTPAPIVKNQEIHFTALPPFFKVQTRFGGRQIYNASMF